MDKDAELLKIQIYSTQCHALLTVRLSFVLALFVALTVALCTVVWQGLGPNPIATWGLGMILVMIFAPTWILVILQDYKKDRKNISKMIEIVKQEKELPKLEDLGKIDESINVSGKSEEKPKPKIAYVNETNLQATKIGALLDFYSDRAVAHASFFVASIFGLVTLLAIIQQLSEDLKWFNIPLPWWSIPLFFAFSYVGYYTLGRFRYYADISHKLSEHGLESEITFKSIRLPYEQTNLRDYQHGQEDKQEKLLILRRIIVQRRGVYYLAISYWVLIGLLGSLVYSKFCHSYTGWIVWIIFLIGFMLVFIIGSPIYYRIKSNPKWMKLIERLKN